MTQGQTTVGTTAVQLLTASTPVRTRTKIKAAGANTGKVYIGTQSSVLTTTGFELAAGQETDWDRDETNDASGIWLIATGASQVVDYRIL